MTWHWLTEHWLAVILFAAYSLMLVHHARIGRRGTRDLGDYYLGGRRVGAFALRRSPKRTEAHRRSPRRFDAHRRSPTRT